MAKTPNLSAAEEVIRQNIYPNGVQAVTAGILQAVLLDITQAAQEDITGELYNDLCGTFICEYDTPADEPLKEVTVYGVSDDFALMEGDVFVIQSNVQNTADGVTFKLVNTSGTVISESLRLFKNGQEITTNEHNVLDIENGTACVWVYDGENLRWLSYTGVKDYGKDIDETITNISSEITENGLVMTATRHDGTEQSILVPFATENGGGLMSAEDKAKIDGSTDYVNNKVISYIRTKGDASSVIISIGNRADGQVDNIALEGATKEQAGLMTKKDIENIEEIQDFLSGVPESTTLVELLDTVSPIDFGEGLNSGVQKTSGNTNSVSAEAEDGFVLGQNNNIITKDPSNANYLPKNAVVTGTNNVSDAKNSHVEGDTNSAVWDVNGAMRRANYSEELIQKYNLTDDASYGADCAHAEGYRNVASGWISHAEGNKNVAAGRNAHAEGHETLAAGSTAHSEGRSTIARGSYSHAQGSNTIANGTASFSAGFHTQANNTTIEGETALGRYNKSDNDTLFSVGIGTSDSNRKNAIEVTETGEILLRSGNNVVRFSSLLALLDTSIDTLSVTQSNGKLLLGINYNNGTSETIDIPIATATANGVMSKEDKATISANTASINTLDAAVDNIENTLAKQEDEIGTLATIVEDNELITASALTDLDTRLNEQGNTITELTETVDSHTEAIGNFGGVLEDIMNGYKLSLTSSPSIIYRNVEATVTGTVQYKVNNTLMKPVTVNSLKINGTEMISEPTSGASVSRSLATSSSSNFQVITESTISNLLNLTSSVTVTVVDPIYYGFADAYTSLTKKLNPTTNYKQEYVETLTSANTGNLFFIAIPTTITTENLHTPTKNHFVMNGTPVAISLTESGTTWQGANYNIYMTDSGYTEGQTLDIFIQ